MANHKGDEPKDDKVIGSSKNAPTLTPPDVQSDNKEPVNDKKGSTGYSPIVALGIVVGLFLFAQIMVVVAIGVYALLTGQDVQFVESILSSNRTLFYISLSISLIQLIGLVWVLGLKQKKLRSLRLVRPVAIDILRAGVSWLVYIGIFVVAVALLQGFDSGIDLEQEQQLDFSAPSAPVELYLIFAALVILPAFIEELLMRGFLFASLRSKLRFWHSTLVVSLLFGFLHTQFFSGEPLLWVAFIDTFILSVVLCYTVEKYKTLWPAILAHGLKNSIAFAYLFLV
jgi:membrane protease YdiL (CAAX protease family)